jgi:hypothetical protein
MQTTISKSVIGALLATSMVTAEATLVMTLQDATNDDSPYNNNFYATLTIENLFDADDIIGVTIDIDITEAFTDNVLSNGSSYEGDILALWLDVGTSYQSQLGDLSVSGRINDDYTFLTNANGVDSIGKLKLNGTDEDSFDIGIQVGVGGNEGGFNPHVSFEMAGGGISEDWFTAQTNEILRAGLRVQSINVDNFGNAGASSKLIGSSYTVVTNDNDGGDGGDDELPPTFENDESDVPTPSTLLLLGAGLLALRTRVNRRFNWLFR